MLQYDMTGDKEFVAFANAFPRELEQATAKGIELFVIILEGTAKRLVYAGHPDHLEGQSGHLRRSITHRVDGLEGEAGTNVFYGEIHEKGMVIEPGTVMHWVDRKTGEDVFATRVEIPARPFMGPTLEKEKHRAPEIIGNALLEVIGP